MSAAAAAPAAAEAEPAVSETPAFTATRGPKPRMRNRWRAMRTAAVAACLALALTGGAAYAYPASTVLVTQGETTVELHVNVFGQVLSASASDDETQGIIDQMGLVHAPFSDSVSRVSDSLKESNPEVPVEVVMNGVTQPADLGVKASEPQGDAAESVSESAKADEGDARSSEPSVVTVVNEPVIAGPVLSTESPVAVYLPEPTYDNGTNSTNESDAGKKSSDHETTKPGKEDSSGANDRSGEGQGGNGGTDNGDTGGNVGGVVEEVVEPVQPVVVDEPGESQDTQPVEDDGAGSGSQEEAEVVYDNIRPPHYHGDDED